MAFDITAMGEKLKRYRDQFQSSINEVSDKTGIPVESLFDFEHGSKEPTGDEILILAEYYKCDYRFFFPMKGWRPSNRQKHCSESMVMSSRRKIDGPFKSAFSWRSAKVTY